MNEDKNEKYKSLLIVNESIDAKVTLYVYGARLLIPVFSKIIQPNEKYLHGEKQMFKFRLVANFDDEREKKEFPGPLELIRDKLIRVTESLGYIEEDLAHYPQEKQICLQKMPSRNRLTSTNGKINLYDILALDMTEVRKLSIGSQKIAIKKAFRDKMKICHPEKKFGDGVIAMQIIVAKETLLDDERQARYHNEADYDEGWLSLKRYQAIFWPDCYTEEQNIAYWHRIAMMAISFGLAAGRVILAAGIAAPAVAEFCLALFGGAIIGAGILSGIDTITKDSVLKSSVLKAGIGFVGGALTGGAAADNTAGVVGIGSAAVESGAFAFGHYALTDVACRTVGSVLSKKFVDKEEVTGALGGCFTKGIVNPQTPTGSVALEGEVVRQSTALAARRSSYHLAQSINRMSTASRRKAMMMGPAAEFTEERLDDSVKNETSEFHDINKEETGEEQPKRVSDAHHKETGEMDGCILKTDMKSADFPEEQAEKKVTEARSLAWKFASAHPFCLAAVPYENKDTQAQKPLTMCLYVNTGGKGIPNDFKDAAHKTFANYEVRFNDFYKRPRSKPVTPNSLSKNEREKKLSKVNEAIEKILHLFEDRLNVTALQASFRVANSIEQEIPCVRVFVLKKGSIPVGETAFPRTVEEVGYELDVAEGYFQPAHGATSTKFMSPLRGGAQISVKEKYYAGTLGGFLKDDEGKHYIISCQHILYDPNESSIVHPAAGNSRSIGNYVRGFKGGVEGTYWVDAAIAELKEEEVRNIRSSNITDDQCSLYGFKESILNGQICDVNELSSEEAGALEFTKIGQKTGLTNLGILNRDLRIKRRDENQQKNVFLSSSNCIIVSSDADEPFCDEGDSGSLFFDNDGRAWGVYFGVHHDLSAGKTYHLASFLRKCLQTLENKTEKNNLHLWVKEEIESRSGKCHIV